MGYFKDTLKGVSWMGALRVVTRVIAFLKIAILARLLTPTQFGVYGIAALVLAFLEISTETGINVFLIQEREDLKKYVSTAWVVSIARGILIALVIILFAPFISFFFKSPDSYKILLFMSLVPFIKGFINPAEIKFQKELEFNKEFLFRSVVFCVDAGVAVLAALITKSPTSLVWGLAAGGVAEVCFSFIFIKPRPRLVFEIPRVKKVVSHGKWMTAYGIFNYLFENIDDIAVGRIMSTTLLGIYQMAYKFSSLPITEIAEVLGKVIFPIFVKISGDINRLKRAFVKAILGVSAIVIPIGFILFYFPRQLVLIILGEAWLEAVPVLKTLAILGVIRAVSVVPNAVFLAKRKQKYVSIITLVSMLGIAATAVPLISKYGLVGAATSAVFGVIISIPFITYYTFSVFRQTR